MSVTPIGDELAWCFSQLLLHCSRKDEGELSSWESTAGFCPPSPSLVVEALWGYVPCRSLADSPVSTFLRLHRNWRKSLLHNHVPVSTVVSGLCVGLSSFAPYVFNTLQAAGRGRGTPPTILSEWRFFADWVARVAVFAVSDLFSVMRFGFAGSGGTDGRRTCGS